MADFVGEPPINLYRNSTLEENQGNLDAVTAKGEYRFKLTPETKRLLEAHRQETVTVGLRPQNISLYQKNGNAALSVRRGAIFEFLGEFGYLTVTNNGLDLSLLTPADLKPSTGEDIDIFYDPQKVLLFDSETEKNLLYKAA